MAELSSFAARLDEVRQRIAASAPTPDRVTLVAVTKKFDVGTVNEALDAGLVDLGENYSQELIAKNDELGEIGSRPDEINWHFVGRLQRNKIKKMASVVSLWQTVDRQTLVTEIAKRAPGARILVQVNTTGEQQKSGCAPNDAAALVDHARSCDLEVAGLMTMGPTDRSNPAPAFERLRKLSDEVGVAELSMGMSADFEVALAEGSTMVRVGSALFGPRSTC